MCSKTGRGQRKRSLLAPLASSPPLLQPPKPQNLSNSDRSAECCVLCAVMTGLDGHGPDTWCGCGMWGQGRGAGSSSKHIAYKQKLAVAGKNGRFPSKKQSNEGHAKKHVCAPAPFWSAARPHATHSHLLCHTTQLWAPIFSCVVRAACWPARGCTHTAHTGCCAQAHGLWRGRAGHAWTRLPGPQPPPPASASARVRSVSLGLGFGLRRRTSPCAHLLAARLACVTPRAAHHGPHK